MEKGWVTVHEKDRAHVKCRQIIHDCLVIIGSILNRHKVIDNMSFKWLFSVTWRCKVSYKYTKAT